MVEPRDAPVADVGVGQRVGFVLERLFEGDERVAARLHHLGQRVEVVRVERVRVEQQDLPDLAAEKAAGNVFDEREDGVHVADVVGADPGRGRLVAAAQGGGVEGGVDVVVVVDRDRRDRVATFLQERLEGPPLVEVEADLEEGMAEVAELHALPARSRRVTGSPRTTSASNSSSGVRFRLWWE